MYINTQTKQQVTEREIRALFPNTSFPKPFVPPAPYAVLFPTPQPTVTVIQRAVQDTPELTSKGTWEQRWKIEAAFATYTDEQGVTHTKADQEAKALADEAAAKVKALQDSVIKAVQERLDDFAKERNYDGILSAATYATSTNTVFQAEGQRAVQLRDDTWQALYNILGQVATQGRVVNSFEDIEADLPVLSWT